MIRAASSADLSTYTGCGEDGAKKLQFIANFFFLTASLVLIGAGSALMGFYRLHLLEVITVEFLVVPLILVIGGITTMFASFFGFYVTAKEDSCLLITYAIWLALEFVILVIGIISSVRLLFNIQTGLFDADVIPELSMYDTDSYIRYKWDILQREFTCCGGYGWTMGYTDWKHTLMGGAQNAVPDSCCLQETPQCGRGIFVITDLRVVIGKIHTHGCITVMLRRLETHVWVMLISYCIVGGLIAIMELLTIVLACCFANQISRLENEDREYDLDNCANGPNIPDRFVADYDHGYHQGLSSPSLPHHGQTEYISQNETAF